MMVEKENGSTSKTVKDLGHINTLVEGKNIKKKRKDGLKRRYKMKRRGLPVTRKEIKENFKAKNKKIKRYQSGINQHQQNRTFKNNQWKFYRELKQWRKELWMTSSWQEIGTRILGECPGRKKRPDWCRMTWKFQEGLWIQRGIRRSRNYTRKD